MLMSTLETGLQTKIPPGFVLLTRLKSWSKNCGIDTIVISIRIISITFVFLLLLLLLLLLILFEELHCVWH